MLATGDCDSFCFVPTKCSRAYVAEIKTNPSFLGETTSKEVRGDAWRGCVPGAQACATTEVRFLLPLEVAAADECPAGVSG